MTLRDRIVELLKRDHVSFAELNRLDGFAGELEIHLDETNIVLWSSVSPEAAETLAQMRDEGALHYEPTTVLTYFVDGIALNYPVARSARQYKTPHWLPVVVRPGRANSKEDAR